MKLKVKCPECARTCKLHVYYVRDLMACPHCGCDFVPARDSFLTCPDCGSIVAACKDYRSRKLSCIECDFEIPESSFETLKRRLRWLLTVSLLDPSTLPFMQR
jgi:uncharacterized C2H2 Zn-finger protein